MSFLINLSIAKKLTLAFSVLIFITLSATGINYRNLTFIQGSAKSSEHTQEVLRTLNLLLVTMVDQETGLRGYLISGNKSFLEPFTKGAAEFDRLYAKATAMTEDNVAQQERLSELNVNVTSWRSTVAQTQIAFMENAETRELAHQMEASGVGRVAMDAMRKKLDEIVEVERTLLSERSAAAAAAFSMSFDVSFGSLVVMVLAAVGALFWLHRRIGKPIAELTGIMRRLADQDLECSMRIPV